MPWKPALCALVLAGCVFDADYGRTYRCTDGRCPSGQVCQMSTQTCVSGVPGDGPTDAPPDGIDARMPALTCVDPGVVAMTGGSASGTTVGRTSLMTAMCGGYVMNGLDAVYRVTAPVAATSYLIEVTGVRAYVIAPCSPSPATPACLGNMFASQGNPIQITTAFAGAHYVVVDHETPGVGGSYTLTVTKQ